MLCNPYLIPERQQPSYFYSCRILSNYKKTNHVLFEAIIGDFRREWDNIATSTSQNQRFWRESRRNSNYRDLIQMVDTRFSPDDIKREYDDSAVSNHEFIYNSDKHVNDKQVIITPYFLALPLCYKHISYLKFSVLEN